MNNVVDTVARNLRQLREQSGLSLAKLATLSGVGKTTLSQIELGYGNPTVGTLEALAETLKVDTSVFLSVAEDEPKIVVVRKNEATLGNHVHTRGVRTGMIEFYRLELEPGVHNTSASHGYGSFESVFVSRGRISITLGGETEVLDEGDYASFPSDRAHVWRNEGDVLAEFWIATSLPIYEPGNGSH